MGGMERHRQPVKKPPSPLGGFDPQPVHRGHQPQDAQDMAQHCLRRGLAVDAHDAGLIAFGVGFDVVIRRQTADRGGDFPA